MTYQMVTEKKSNWGQFERGYSTKLFRITIPRSKKYEKISKHLPVGLMVVENSEFLSNQSFQRRTTLHWIKASLHAP